MATEALAHGSHLANTHPVVAVVMREACHWMMARASDGLEATFSLDVDERYWRLRCTHGATASMFEAKSPGALSAGDLVAAIARWAVSAGLVMRSTHEDGAFRVTLTRPAD